MTRMTGRGAPAGGGGAERVGRDDRGRHGQRFGEGVVLDRDHGDSEQRIRRRVRREAGRVRAGGRHGGAAGGVGWVARCSRRGGWGRGCGQREVTWTVFEGRHGHPESRKHATRASTHGVLGCGRRTQAGAPGSYGLKGLQPKSKRGLAPPRPFSNLQPSKAKIIPRLLGSQLRSVRALHIHAIALRAAPLCGPVKVFVFLVSCWASSRKCNQTCTLSAARL